MKKKNGFTLIEMLVVIGIIAILSGAIILGMGKIQKTAQKTKALESVSNAATALGVIFQTEMNWPNVLISKSGQQLDQEVAKVFVRFKLLGVSYDTKAYNAFTRKGTITLTGADRCGIADPWATTVLKNSSSANASSKVPTGGTVQDHLIWYAVDTDGDGITEASVGGVNVRVRAPAIAWCAGADGKLGPYGRHSKEGQDDVYSWARGQEAKK